MIKLNNKAQESFDKWLPEEVIAVILGLTMPKYVTKIARNNAIRRILSNPQIYGMVIMDWMESEGYPDFDTDKLSDGRWSCRIWDERATHDIIGFAKEKTEAFKSLVEKFDKKQFGE